MNRLASPMSLIVAAILGGLVSQGMFRWMPDVHAQEPKVQDEIRTKGIVVVDESGNVRIRIGKVKLGDGLELLGTDGQSRASLKVTKDNIALLQVWHKDGPDGPFEGSLSPVGVRVQGKGKEEGQKTWASMGVGGGQACMLLKGNPSVLMEDFQDKQIWKAP